MRISFIGAGNVAWHLAQAFEDAGHFIEEIYSRNPQHARQLVGVLYDARIQPDLHLAESQADLIVLAVSDTALEEIVQRAVFPEGVVLVHTSGATSLAALEQWVSVYSDVPLRTGVLYPLQTFTKADRLDYTRIPFCIEATAPATEELLTQLAGSVSEWVYRINSRERGILHTAAVFANNFTTHLLGMARDVLDHEQLPFELLKPLIERTFLKALASDDPASGQTGPAVRGDWESVNRHLLYLQEQNPDWAQLYRHLTESIRMKHL